MSSTTAPSIAHLQQPFQALLTMVSGPDSHQQTATTVERTLFRGVLALGLGLLRLFCLTRTAVRPAKGAPAGRKREASVTAL